MPEKKNRRIEKFITSYAFLPSDTDSARRDTNKQTHKHTNTKLKLCGPWLAPDVTEVTSSA